MSCKLSLVAAMLLLSGCGGPGLSDFPRNNAQCEFACQKLQFMGCPEGSDIACVHVCVERESRPYMQPMAECVAHETDMRKCGVRCGS